MPGRGMPNYDQRIAVIAKHAHYGPTEFYTEVIDELMKYWDIAQLQPDYAPAREAQLKLLAYHNRLGKIAARQLRERNRVIVQAEAEDRATRE
jgi:acyl-[acyl-carrier-protein] desaturase